MCIIKVAANSRVSVVAADIVAVIRDHQQAEVLAIEEEAVNLAFKAVDLVIVYFRRDDIYIRCVMESLDSMDESIDENKQTAIRLIIEPQSSLDCSFELTRQFPILT